MLEAKAFLRDTSTGIAGGFRSQSKNSDHPDGCSEFLVGEGGFEVWQSHF